MDYISFNLTESTQVDNKDYQMFDIIVLINGQQLNFEIFNTLEVIAAHECTFAEFDLFTCSCGVPGCAGFENPIIQKIQENKVYWYFPIEGYYKTDKLEYVFNKKQFFEAFSTLVEVIESKEEDKKYLFSNVDLEYSEAKILTLKDLDYYKNKFKKNEEIHLFLMNFAPDLYESLFSISFENENYQYHIKLDWLVKSIINYQFSENEKEFKEEIIKVIQAIRDSLNGNNLLLETLVKQYYKDIEDGFITRWFINKNDNGTFSEFNKIIIKINKK